MVDIIGYSPFFEDSLAPLAREWASEFWSLEEIKRSLKETQNFSRILVLGEEVLGFSMFSINDSESELLFLYVPQSQRKKGFAKKLLEDYFQLGRTHAVSSYFLEVREGNHAAISLYEDFGYEQIAERKKYYKDGETAKILKKVVC